MGCVLNLVTGVSSIKQGNAEKVGGISRVMFFAADVTRGGVSRLLGFCGGRY